MISQPSYLYNGNPHTWKDHLYIETGPWYPGLSVDHIDGLAQERHNSIANALELRLSCTNPLIYTCLCTSRCQEIDAHCNR